MKKKSRHFLILIPIFILIPIALLLIYHFFIYRIVELKQIEMKTSNIVKMINNKEVVKDEFKLKVKNESNKKLYNDLSDYFKDITTSTNNMNEIASDKHKKSLFTFKEKNFEEKKKELEDIASKALNSYDALKMINAKEYYYYLDKDNQKNFKDFTSKLNLGSYDKVYKTIKEKNDYYTSIIDFLIANKDNLDINENSIVFKKRNVFNSFKELVKEDKSVKYELVKDETGPVIEASNLSTYTGNNVDIKSKVKCTDEVDGDVECVISGSYDINKAGTYTINIKATDQSGNTSSKDITLTVSVYNPYPYNTGSPYYIHVIRNQNVVIVYGLDSSNHYSNIVKVFVVSVGKSSTPTPTGTFKTSDKYRWGLLYGGVYGQYSTRFNGAILFHSVPYYSMNPGDLEWEEYNKLGSGASAGCVRMKVSDVKWIYDNCPKGTYVKVFDGDLPNGVTKPSAQKLPADSPNKGWDPTDPDPSNPWK